MNKELYSELNEYLDEHLNHKRRKHVKGVVKTAVKLANKYGEDPDKAKLAALFHDMFRWLKDENLASYIDILGLDESLKDSPNLAHSKIAAKIMQRDYNINDEDVINAVCFHTTGRDNMSKLEKIIYLADAIEPNRDYPSVKKLRKLADKDLDLACLESLENTVNFLIAQNKTIDDDTLKAIEYFRRLKE